MGFVNVNVLIEGDFTGIKLKSIDSGIEFRMKS